MSKPKVVELTKTCKACPAQWEGQLDDGRVIYVRYRWGGLSVGMGATLDDALVHRVSVTLPNESEEPTFDGEMDDATMKQATGNILNWDVCEPGP